MDWATIITSAAVGAVTGSIVNAITGWRERTARRRELAYQLALKSVERRTDMVRDIASKTHRTLTIRDEVILSVTYFGWIMGILEKGALPPDAKETPPD